MSMLCGTSLSSAFLLLNPSFVSINKLLKKLNKQKNTISTANAFIPSNNFPLYYILPPKI